MTRDPRFLPGSGLFVSAVISLAIFGLAFLVVLS